MRFIRALLLLIVFAALVAGGAYVIAGRSAGPSIEIRQPERVIGQAAKLDVSVGAPEGRLSAFTVALEQSGKSWRVFDLASPKSVLPRQESPDRIRLERPLTRADVPELREGPVRLVVTAARPVLFGYRIVEATASRDLEARFVPPRISVISTHHYINFGGSEMVVYRVTPPDVESGVRVGDVTYAGFPAAGAGISSPDVKVAFFALLHDQDVNTPIEAFARDSAGNEAKASFDFRVFPKVFRRSRIELDDRFLDRVGRRSCRALLRSRPTRATSSRPFSRSTASSGERTRRKSRRWRPRHHRRCNGAACSSRSSIRRSNPPSQITGLTFIKARRSTSRSTSGSTSRAR
jgi:hypothetical protein